MIRVGSFSKLIKSEANYVANRLKARNMSVNDLQARLPCSINMLQSKEPFLIQGEKVLDLEVNSARKIPEGSRRIIDQDYLEHGH